MTSAARPGRRAVARLSRAGPAREAIAGWGRGTDVLGLTMGQFSLLDLIGAVLEVTGPAHVLVSTWSSGIYDAEAAARWASDGRMLSVRVLMDSGRQATGQMDVVGLAALLGPGAVRATRLHAKFAVVTNAEWSAVVTTSMNLNLNRRVEHFTLSDDAAWARLLLDFADSVWAEEPEGGAGDRRLPSLRGMAGAPPAIRAGRARTGP